MSEVVYTPILDFLGDHKPRTLAQIEQAVKDKGIPFVQVLQAVLVLSGAGHLMAVQDDALIAKARKHTDKLNAHLMQKARGSHEVGYLASPVSGGAVAVARFPQLFLVALAQGKKQPADWVPAVWALLQAQGQKLIKDGKALETPEENLAELLSQATVFAQKQLPILKALMVA
jgi:hypothetical protein